MSKNILLPTDFSDNAYSAAIYTLKLYKEEQCTFHFLHSSKLNASSMSSMSNKLARVLAEKARLDLTDLKTKIERDYANDNHTFEIILSTNDLHSLIDVVVEKENIDLIVIGTKGETKAKEILFGSNTVNTIKQVKNCPILVIPNKFDFVKPEQIAFPTDFNRVYGDELLPLKQLADLNNSKIRIVHINNENDISEPQKQNLALLETTLNQYNYSIHWMSNFDRKAKAIQEFTEEFRIDILAMVNYKHSFIENIMKEPVITNISFHPTIPFLIIPQN
ncbi:universal stress protein [Winogradskyella costae]|uniref:universal stress protein n=1 Tax=Winogradskyella costae TaxID=2697008 RepID=UPI0015CC4D07|nr:universal stress protein [Winogradskyella costae]